MATLSLKAPQRGSARQVAYVGIAVAIAMWSTVVLLFAINIVPIDVYWTSYYAVDYTFGFVRRASQANWSGWSLDIISRPPLDCAGCRRRSICVALPLSWVLCWSVGAGRSAG